MRNNALICAVSSDSDSDSEAPHPSYQGNGKHTVKKNVYYLDEGLRTQCKNKDDSNIISSLSNFWIIY